jgi:hypothetical protein
MEIATFVNHALITVEIVLAPLTVGHVALDTLSIQIILV